MTTRNNIISIGVGVSAFCIVAGIVTELLSSIVAFSVFVGLPAGILAGLAAAVVTLRSLQDEPSERVRRGFAAVARFGYALVLLAAARYAIEPTPPVLSLPVIVVVAVVSAVAVYIGPRIGSAED